MELLAFAKVQTEDILFDGLRAILLMSPYLPTCRDRNHLGALHPHLLFCALHRGIPSGTHGVPQITFEELHNTVVSKIVPHHLEEIVPHALYTSTSKHSYEVLLLFFTLM
jgi:hypothetical protein